MTEQEIYDGVVVNGTTDFILVAETLRRHGAGWCVIGGLAVNSYVAPVYTADFDLVVLAADLEPVLADLRAADFRVKEFSSSINAQRRAGPAVRPTHQLMVRFTTPDQYQPFVERAGLRPIFGKDVPVAALADLVQGELWTREDSRRRASKSMQAGMNLLRLADGYFAEVAPRLPDALRTKAEANLRYVADGWGRRRSRRAVGRFQATAHHEGKHGDQRSKARAMFKFIARRLLETIPVLLIIYTGSFFLMKAAPGGPFDSERRMTPEIERNLNAFYDLDKPLWVQYTNQLGKIVFHGDFGPSTKYANRTVNELIGESLPVSLELGVFGMVIALVAGISAGIIASLRPNTATDYVPMSLAMAGVCVPTFVLGPLLVLVFAMRLRWFNPSGWDEPSDYVLPSLTLGFYYAAYLARLTRGGMLEILSQDYIRTARAKGASEVRVVLRHALRGGLLPVVSFPRSGARGNHQRVVRGGDHFPGPRPGSVFHHRRFQPRLLDGDRHDLVLCGAHHLVQPDRRRRAGMVEPETALRLGISRHATHARNRRSRHGLPPMTRRLPSSPPIPKPAAACGATPGTGCSRTSSPWPAGSW